MKSNIKLTAGFLKAQWELFNTVWLRIPRTKRSSRRRDLKMGTVPSGPYIGDIRSIKKHAHWDLEIVWKSQNNEEVIAMISCSIKYQLIRMEYDEVLRITMHISQLNVLTNYRTLRGLGRQDRSTDRSVEYWFQLFDLDGDGVITD